jgi:adenosylmethionine-8-amino-7-oxononanoate aminotransferase
MDNGITRYHCNIETAPSYFASICTTHSIEDKLNTIRTARAVDMEICCGGIISLGETAAQRLEMAFTLRELDVDSVPLNILNPIPGTPLEKQPMLPVEEIIRTIAVFRLILPDKALRFAGGRQKAMGEAEYAGYEAGMNALLAGDFLTTFGKSVSSERDKLAEFGYLI